MRFAYSDWIVLTALAAAVAAFVLLGLIRRRLALRRLVTPHAIPPVRFPLRRLKAGLLFTAAALLALTLLGPQWGETTEEGDYVNGRDLLIVLDVSRSMLAEDVSPNRLERAKADARDLVRHLEEHGGYRVGLVAFAERAALLCPLTSDFRCFEEELARATLDSLRLRGNVGLADDGTQLALALRRVEAAVDHTASAHTDVLVFSDGGDLGPDTMKAAEDLSRKGLAVHAVGLGDPDAGATIPVHGDDGRRTALRHKGEVVRVRLDEGPLRAIAEKTGGRYFGVGTRYAELDKVFAPILADKEQRALAMGGTHKIGIHRFQWLLAPALALLLAELFLSDGRRRIKDAVQRRPYFTRIRRRPAATVAVAERASS